MTDAASDRRAVLHAGAWGVPVLAVAAAAPQAAASAGTGGGCNDFSTGVCNVDFAFVTDPPGINEIGIRNLTDVGQRVELRHYSSSEPVTFTVRDTFGELTEFTPFLPETASWSHAFASGACVSFETIAIETGIGLYTLDLPPGAELILGGSIDMPSNAPLCLYTGKVWLRGDDPFTCVANYWLQCTAEDDV
ncbi:hypothetical protein C5E07_14420 [Pseudoclavibacter sp. RFBJ3]|uniref:hypothetical protein n=1 Tax=unclassified Pseudoclavibacter TaxID=2615177 RepID=UPI000CE876DF|nr:MULTISPECIES: hypothetical protein [unclassified Pseudoclavibacter]PPF36142.1 hypothetical protein C5E05_11700 [Pseudoclavibacter sp. AY1H1]PPF73431.1 hypothetical protein C5B99_15820 [Pseudoclavibacter sp. Z016]PPF81465.1 hypothetical protein C5C12_14160 [Pseudoclavibacter sp. RFBJ5]PPF90796.1 hypothetical protein C5E07_14420 [Pseudoclavibacter sp. RFBJ3]PPG00072.1 hypothetical protein C5C19_02330 [Pseudoclavibacter sp. RFBH5]